MASFTGRMKSYWALVCNDADRMSASMRKILLIIFGMSLCFVLIENADEWPFIVFAPGK